MAMYVKCKPAAWVNCIMEAITVRQFGITAKFYSRLSHEYINQMNISTGRDAALTT